MIDTAALAAAAARLAADGFRLVPLRAAGKIPLIDDWPNRATADPGTIAGWWATWPEANIGIATGAGLLVIDVDEDGQHSGETTLRALEADLGPLPRTLTVRTGGGGLHIYLRTPAGTVLGNSVRQLGAGIDIRADGGQVVAPPSLHKNGRRYEYVNEAAIADIPPAWLQHIGKARVEREREPLRLEDGELIADGARNDTLFRLGSSMRAKGFDAVAIGAALAATNAQRCRPPVPQRELDTIVASICRYEAGDPGGVITHGEHGTAAVPTEASDGDWFESALRTARQLGEEAPEDLAWIAQPIIARGTVAKLDGPPKRSGKTTFLLAMIGAMQRSEDFLGYAQRPAKVLILTEEHTPTFRRALEDAGLLESEDVVIMTFGGRAGHRWADVMARANEACLRHSFALLVIDTMSRWADIKGDDENHTGVWNDRIAALEPIKAAGVGILITHHDKRAGGDVGQSGKGSNALEGAVDQIFQLRRPDTGAAANVRELHSIGRYRDLTPEKLTIRLVDGRYESMGDGEAPIRETAEAKALTVLRNQASTAADAKTIKDLMKLTSISRPTLQRALLVLEETGKVVKFHDTQAAGQPLRWYSV